MALTDKDFSLLVALLGAGGRPLSRAQLLELSRLHDDEVYDRAVDMQIMRLRRKLGENSTTPRYILTLRGAAIGSAFRWRLSIRATGIGR